VEEGGNERRPTQRRTIRREGNNSARTPLSPENPEGYHQHESSRSDVIRRGRHSTLNQRSNTAHHIYPKQDNIRRNPRHQSNLTKQGMKHQKLHPEGFPHETLMPLKRDGGRSNSRHCNDSTHSHGDSQLDATNGEGT